MAEFRIQYKIGKSGKLREKVIADVEDRKQASIRFHTEGPDNSYISHIEEVKEEEVPNKSSLTRRAMKIENSFDQFLIEALETQNKLNQDLLDFLGMTRTTWSKLRKHPEKLQIADLMRISEFLDVEFSKLADEARQVAEQHKKSDTLEPMTFRKR